MATNPANAAAYIGLQPTQSGIAQDLQFWSQDARMRKQEDRMERQFQAEQEQREYQRKKDMYDKYIKPLAASNTGSKSLNETLAKTLALGVKKRYELYKKLQGVDPYSDEGIQLQMQMDAINQLPEKLKMVSDYYTTQDAQIEQMYSSGALYEDEYQKYKGHFKDGFSNVVVGLDDMFNPLVAFEDVDGDGIPDPVKGQVRLQPFEEIQGAIPTVTFTPKIDFVGAAAALASKLKSETNTEEIGNFTTRKTTTPPEDVIRAQSENLFSDDRAFKAFFKTYNMQDTPENREFAKNNWSSLVLSMMARGKEDDPDYSARLQAQKLADERAGAGAKTDPAPVGEAVPPSKQNYSNNYDKLDTDNYNSVPIVEKVPIIGLNTVGGEQISNVLPQSYSFDKEGRMVVDVAYIDKKSMRMDDWEAVVPGYKQMSDTDKMRARLLNADAAATTFPEKVVRKDVVVAKEDESKIAASLKADMQTLRQRASKTGTVPTAEQTPEMLRANSGKEKIPNF